YTGSCLHAGGNPGAGGGYPGATGGKGAGFNDNLCTVNNPATAAGSYGAGGGGGNGNGSSFTEGTDGICIISWCNIDVSTTVTGITITANDTAATSFQWIDCTVEMPIDGDTSASFTPLYDGDYAVIVTEGGCTDTSACVSITGVGINPYQHLEQIITVYPNPFTNTLKVSAGKNASFQLMNAVGQVVWSGKQIETVDFSFLPSNVYLLKVMDQNQTQVIRLVK
ncbi:MAG TPA: T9SS type A sorting domain-containing protein, partial [Flavobacteriales bacterium]|nr:T9SS type A sorting domain-containing protein [Flavobacteriales bacterium]